MSSNLSEHDAELIVKKLLEENDSRKKEKYNKVTSKLKNAKEFAFEAQEGSLLFAIKWVIAFIGEMIKAIKEAASARRIEKENKE